MNHQDRLDLAIDQMQKELSTVIKQRNTATHTLAEKEDILIKQLTTLIEARHILDIRFVSPPAPSAPEPAKGEQGEQ